MNWKERGRKRSWPILYSAGICLEDVTKSTKKSQNGRRPDQDLKPASPSIRLKKHRQTAENAERITVQITTGELLKTYWTPFATLDMTASLQRITRSTFALPLVTYGFDKRRLWPSYSNDENNYNIAASSRTVYISQETFKLLKMSNREGKLIILSASIKTI
jgi:hypothetical protein